MRSFVALLCFGLLTGCTSARKSTVDTSKPLHLQLGGKVGDVTHTAFHSESAIQDLEDGQKVRDRHEVLDFLVAQTVIGVRDQQIAIRTKTLSKDGTGSLHDLAFPELHQQLDFIYSKSAEVLMVEELPKDSIFYLPPISLPGKPVQVGDTWTMNHSWVSANTGMPLNINLVTIFKDVVDCGKHGPCADLEVAGKVDMLGTSKRAKFDSKIWGRILFAIETGEILWSEVHAKDAFKTAAAETRVRSCMISKILPNAKSSEKLVCDLAKASVRPISIK